MDDPFKHAPAELGSRVEEYVAKAAGLGIEPILVAKYARIFIAAQEELKYRNWRTRNVLDEGLRVAAFLHRTYEEDPEKARAAYADARQRQQAIHGSASGCSKSLAGLERLLHSHYRLLPHDVAAKFPLPSLLASIDFIQRFASATSPHPTNLTAVKMAKSDLSLTESGHTLLWWWKLMGTYRGKWNDMFALARCWGLTTADDPQAFRRRVLKLQPTPNAEGVTWIMGCPPWALS